MYQKCCAARKADARDRAVLLNLCFGRLAGNSNGAGVATSEIVPSWLEAAVHQAKAPQTSQQVQQVSKQHELFTSAVCEALLCSAMTEDTFLIMPLHVGLCLRKA